MRTGAPERCEVSPERGDKRTGDKEETEEFGFTSSVNNRVPGNKHQKLLLRIRRSLPVWTYPGGGASWTSPQGDVRGDRCGLMLPR